MARFEITEVVEAEYLTLLESGAWLVFRSTKVKGGLDIVFTTRGEIVASVKRLDEPK